MKVIFHTNFHKNGYFWVHQYIWVIESCWLHCWGWRAKNCTAERFCWPQEECVFVFRLDPGKGMNRCTHRVLKGKKKKKNELQKECSERDSIIGPSAWEDNTLNDSAIEANSVFEQPQRLRRQKKKSSNSDRGQIEEQNPSPSFCHCHQALN